MKSEQAKKIIYVIIAAVAIIYNLLPIDAIPDVIPVVGAIDDVAVALIPLVMGYRAIAKNGNKKIGDGS